LRSCTALAPAKQPAEKGVRSCRALERERYSYACPFEAAPQLVGLDGNAAAVDLDHQPARSIRGVELGIERRVDLLKEAVDFLTPRRQEPARSQQRLRVILKPSRIAAAKLADAGLVLDTRDSGDRQLQLRPRQARKMTEERPLIPLLGGEQRRPLLKLHEDEGAHGRRQAPEDLLVRPRERCGVSGQSCVELHC